MSFGLISVSEFEKVKENVFVVKAPVVSCPEIIEGTDCVMKLGFGECESLPEDKTKEIVVYCCRGYASQIVARDLITKGYKKVYSLNGGMYAYQRFFG